MATSGEPGPGDNAAPAARRRTPLENSQGGHYATRQPSRWKRNIIMFAALAAAIWIAWTWRQMREEALVGAAFGARVGCVCRFVSARPLASCEADLKVAGLGGAARWIFLSEDLATRTVKASVPMLAKQSADFDPVRGCQLEPWRD